MESQLVVNHIIPLASAVAVVLISSATNIWLKKLDVQQRQADYKQELGKVLLVKKLEAGEAFVASVVAIINQLDGLRVLLIAGLPGAEDDQYYELLQKLFQKLHDSTASMITKERNAAYLYFDSTVLEQEAGSEVPRIIQLEKNFVGFVSEKRDIERLLEDDSMDKKSRSNVIWSHKENEKKLLETKEEYAKAVLSHRAYLVRVCGILREQLAKYDLPDLA